MTKQSMQALVDKAESFGVVERRTMTADRRAKIVSFTPTGLCMLARFREAVAETEQAMAHIIGESAFSDLKSSLTIYAQMISHDKTSALPET